MKSYNGLYNRMVDEKEIEQAIIDASRKKRKRPIVKRIFENKEEIAKEIRKQILCGKWKPPDHKVHELNEGAHKKKRNIIKPRFDNEQIVHHMLIRQLKPILYPKIYRYAYGSISKRGTHACVKALKKFRDSYNGKRFYVLECDIHHFYDSINKDILKGDLDRLIRDRKFKEILFLVIDGYGPGLPKGTYTSPWLSHYYMMPFDNYVVQDLKPDHYVRFVDNIFIMCRSKRKLHRIFGSIKGYLAENLDLEINDNWQIFRFEDSGEKHGRYINAIGFTVHRNHIGVRKSTLKRIRAKAHMINKKKKYTYHDCGSMMARISCFKHADCYGYYKDHIKPYVNIRHCKRRISEHDRRKNRNDKLERSA